MADAITYTEDFTADGSLSSVTTAHPISFLPALTLDGVAQTLKIGGVDAPGQNAWYWTSGSSTLSHGTATPPAFGVVIEVVYQFELSNAISVSAPSVITAQGLNGRSGIIQRVVDARGLTDVAQAQAVASGILRRASTIPQTVKFATDSVGWAPGQVMPCDVPKLNLSGTYLVTSVSSTSVGAEIGETRTSFHRVIELLKIQAAPAQEPVAADPSIPSTSYVPPSFTSTIDRTIEQTKAPVPPPQFYTETFLFGVGGNITGGVQSANNDITMLSGTIVLVAAYATTPPAGQKAVIDITADGASIFHPNFLPEIAAGQTTITTQGRFLTYPFDYRINRLVKLRGTITYVTASLTPTPASGLTVKLLIQF